jgi:hypothetical protein
MTSTRSIALKGLAATAAATLVPLPFLGGITLWRCGGFFGEHDWVPGTLSEDLCTSPWSGVMFAAAIAGPVVIGLGGTWRAIRLEDESALWPAIASAVAVPVTIGLLYLVSGEL